MRTLSATGETGSNVTPMQTPDNIKQLLSAQTERLDTELERFFSDTPTLPLYEHLAYFMGFKNEALEPHRTYGGKRFRASLMLLLANWYHNLEPTVPFAMALELYHNFTLIHDDVVDRDTHRRGRPTVWHLFGTDHAINDGDAQLLLVGELLAKAASEHPSPAGVLAQQFLLKQFRVVVEGQYLDFELTKAALGSPAATQANYIEMIRCKTAELIVAASKGAGIIAEQSPSELDNLERYGRSLGLAYQICDDVVSIWATSEATGKRNYGDIKERKKTLPVLYAYEQLDGRGRQQLQALFTTEHELSDADCEEVIALLDTVDTKGVMEAVITEHANAAKAAAGALSISSEQQATLSALVDSLLPTV